MISYSQMPDWLICSYYFLARLKSIKISSHHDTLVAEKLVSVLLKDTGSTKLSAYPQSSTMAELIPSVSRDIR